MLIEYKETASKGSLQSSFQLSCRLYVTLGAPFNNVSADLTNDLWDTKAIQIVVLNLKVFSCK